MKWHTSATLKHTREEEFGCRLFIIFRIIVDNNTSKVIAIPIYPTSINTGWYQSLIGKDVNIVKNAITTECQIGKW